MMRQKMWFVETHNFFLFFYCPIIMYIDPLLASWKTRAVSAETFIALVHTQQCTRYWEILIGSPTIVANYWFQLLQLFGHDVCLRKSVRHERQRAGWRLAVSQSIHCFWYVLTSTARDQPIKRAFSGIYVSSHQAITIWALSKSDKFAAFYIMTLTTLCFEVHGDHIIHSAWVLYIR